MVTPHSYYSNRSHTAHAIIVTTSHCCYPFAATGSNKKAIHLAIICKCSYLHFCLNEYHILELFMTYVCETIECMEYVYTCVGRGCVCECVCLFVCLYTFVHETAQETHIRIRIHVQPPATKWRAKPKKQYTAHGVKNLKQKIEEKRANKKTYRNTTKRKKSPA